MTHYDTLRVLPSAEEPVIRSAYRSLMRLYHPDTNPSPEAQLRVREISAAFAVLGDPSRRAAYDSELMLHNGIDVGQCLPSAPRSGPPMRNLGIASIALALAMSLAAPKWLEANQPAQPGMKTKLTSDATQTTTAADFVSLLSARDSPRLNDSRGSPARPVTEPAREATLAHPTASVQSDGNSVILRRDAGAALATNEAGSVPRATAALARMPRRAAVGPIQRLPKQAVAADTRPTRPVTCPGGSSKVGPCSDVRKAEIARLASGFLDQSIANADWHKQQLLLSARNRAAFSRVACHSDDCVIGTYMRQMRETTEIMQGRIPTP